MDERTAVASRRGENYGGRSRQERATDRRDRILTSALHLFGTRDYEDVTVADVCTGARISKRYFYEHFVDRGDLVTALHHEQNQWLLGQVAAVVPELPSGLEETLRPAARTLLRLLRANPERAQVIYINAPRMETRRRGVMREDAAFLAALLRRVSGRVGDERMLLALVAGVSEVIIDWLSRGMTEDPDVLADQLADFCLAVLRIGES